GREWLVLDTDEEIGSEVLVDDGLDQLEGLRRHVVDEPRELLYVHVGEEIRARGEQLAELQVGRPELLEREPELTGPLARGRTLAAYFDLAQHAEQPPASCPIPRAWCPRRQTRKRDRPGRGRAGSSLVKFERFYQCPSTKPPKTRESATSSWKSISLRTSVLLSARSGSPATSRPPAGSAA